MVVEASDLFISLGLMFPAPFDAARVDMKDFCLSVGASLPVVHWEGLSSCDAMATETSGMLVSKVTAFHQPKFIQAL